ncbi:MAG: ABC transporter substrate-binding protein [Acidimicrobiia bacterium]|jgi:branched-chain amino acid transport system substrate-binding protein
MRRRRAGLAVASLITAVGVLGALAGPAGAAGAATKPAGAPIPIQLVNLDATSSTASARQGAAAAVKYLNQTGGIAGRPVQVDECLTDQTPEKGKACIDKAIAAPPAAVLSVQPGTAADNLAALTAAGIPYVGQTCNTNTTLSGQFTSFCFGSDFVGLYSSSANYLKTLGTVKKAALPYVNVPAAATGVKAYATPILLRAGIAPAEVPIPEGTADVTATITPAIQASPDAVISLLTGPGCISTIKLKASLNVAKPFVFPGMCTDADVLADAGAGSKGTLYVRQTITTDKRNADVKAYLKAMAKYAKGADPDDIYAQAGFAGVMNLAAAMKLVPAGTTVDATSTTAALRTAKAVPMFLTGGATYTCDGSAFAGLKSLCSLQAHVLEYQGKDHWTDKGLF